MSLADRFLRVAHAFLPSPFTIALILTLATFVLALIFTEPAMADINHLVELGVYWQDGFWGFLTFAMQMMLILVLGHSLALTKPVQQVLDRILPFCTNTANSALIVGFIALCMAYINWGLGLIVGAILVRKVGEHALSKSIPLNYPLVGAAGYVGLMVWHGGLSGSAPLKVAEDAHNLSEVIGVIPAGETIGSTLNLTVIVVTLLVIPLFLYFLGKRSASGDINLPVQGSANEKHQVITGAERIDHSKWVGIVFGFMMVLLSIRTIWVTPDKLSLSFLNLNFINYFIFGACLMLHGSVNRFLNSVGEAIRGSSGILIQFPLYAGIMGIMDASGLIALVSNHFTSIATETSFPILTLLSAAMVNVFVPSGGGQWIIQGPIIVESAMETGVPVAKSIMALAYGDQLTNMLQPFWALPLLGITGLKARELLPYTFLLFVLGLVIFSTCLMIF